VLSTDRGWLRWQDPWGMGKPNEAAEMESWARKVMEHEIDLWASLDASGGRPPKPAADTAAVTAAAFNVARPAALRPKKVLTPEEARRMRHATI
jgi:hypothetical protein